MKIKRSLLVLTLLACFWLRPQFAWCAPPLPLPSPGELQFIDNYAGDATKVVWWWNDGWMPNHWNIVATAEVDPNSNYCRVYPVVHRFIFGANPDTGTYSVAPAKFVIIDMLDTNDPCIADFSRQFIPRVWHVRLVPD